jgi:3-oxoacyl-[acyl-carrier protein] reductase
MPFQGKVAMISGGGRGIGAATARLLAKRGANIIINYLTNTEAAEGVVAAIQGQGGRAKAVQADILDAPSCNRLVREALETFGQLDMLVHSANVPIVLKSFAELTS